MCEVLAVCAKDGSQAPSVLRTRLAAAQLALHEHASVIDACTGALLAQAAQGQAQKDHGEGQGNALTSVVCPIPALAQRARNGCIETLKAKDEKNIRIKCCWGIWVWVKEWEEEFAALACG